MKIYNGIVMNLEIKTKPKFFSLVGWSWVSLGIMGVLAGALGLLSIPGILTMKRMLFNAEEGFSPEMGEAVYPFLRWWIPGVIIKFVLSALLTYVSFVFLKGKRWAYLTLMWLNYWVLIGTLGGYFFGMAGLQTMVQKVQSSGAFEGTGFDFSMPSMYHPLLLSLLFLVILPFVFCAWYFHWRPVKDYFAKRSSPS